MRRGRPSVWNAEKAQVTRRYPFVALEGCDGVGKSTIRDVLRDALVAAGTPVAMVGQHSWLSPRVAQLIVDVRERRRRHSPEAIVEAYAIDKQLHTSQTIEPALSKYLVIADRSIVSDAVYQEALYGIPAEVSLRQHASRKTRFPDCVVFVHTDVKEAYRRVSTRSKHKRHYERPTDMRKIMSVYARLLKQLPVMYPQIRVVEFDNTAPEYSSRVESELAPKIARIDVARAP